MSRNGSANFASLNSGAANIGFRSVRTADAGGGIKVFVSDFSIPHGLSNVEVIHNLLFSNEKKQRKMAESMLKNAAILADLTGTNYNTLH